MFAIIASSLLLLLEGSGDSAELFSTLNTVFALLDRYDTQECAGVEVKFHKNGKYYDKGKGVNWWEYYFEPLKLGAGEVKRIHNFEKRIYSLTAQFEMPVERSSALFQKYVKIRPEIWDKVPKVEGALGVYYHKPHEGIKLQPPVAYDLVLEKIKEQLALLEPNAPLFVVTAEEKLVKFLEEQFPGRVLTYTDAKKGKYGEGERELIQALALSKTKALIRTCNTFSKGITQINAQLFAVDLDKNWQEKE